jgi:hypothetical protein
MRGTLSDGGLGYAEILLQRYQNIRRLREVERKIYPQMDTDKHRLRKMI